MWCKVGGNHSTHLARAKKSEGEAWRLPIGNDKGGTNGWIGFEAIFGRAISAGGRPL